MSPRKKPAPRAVVDDAAAEQTAGEDAAAGAALEAIRQAQRDAVLGPARSAPLMRDDTLPAPMVADVLARFREAGYAWALTGRIEFGDLAPTFVEVEPHEEGPPMFRVSLFGMGAVNGGYRRGLAERYLAECALVGDETRTASERLNSRALWRSQVHALRVMREDAPPDMAERFTRTSGNVRDISDYLTRFDAWRFDVAFAEKSGTTVPPEPEPPAWLSPPKAQALASVARELTKPQADGSVLLVANRRNLETRLREEVPFVRALLDELAALTETCERPATLEDVDAWTLGREDGTLAPTPEAWLESLAARGEQHRADASAWLYMGMEALATDARKAREADLKACTAELERQLEEQRARTEKAERETLRERKKRQALEAGLPDRTVIPGQLIRSGFLRDSFRSYSAQLAAGQTDMFVDGAADIIREQAEVKHAQLRDVTAPEVRAMNALFRLFTRAGDDRGWFNEDTIEVDATTVYRAAGLTSRNKEVRAALFNGLLSLSRRSVSVALTLPEEDGTPLTPGEKRRKKGKGARVYATQTRIFSMAVEWHASTNKGRPLSTHEADAIRDYYLRHAGGSGAWTGRLPDAFVFTLPPFMRRVAERLVLCGDVLERLEAGSRAARGATHGLNPLDWQLLIEITQHEQRGQRSAGHGRFRSYVDRERFLLDYHGEEKIAGWRRAGKLKERAIEPYEKAIRSLMKGGLVAHWEPYQTAKGEYRDVFELLPDVMEGTDTRIQRQDEARQLREEERKRRALPKSRRPRKKGAA